MSAFTARSRFLGHCRFRRGHVKTPFHAAAQSSTELIERFLDDIPMKRFGEPEEIGKLALGCMVDLSSASRRPPAYHAGREPEVRMGRQLASSRIGIFGYGNIGRHLAILAKAVGMEPRRRQA